MDEFWICEWRRPLIILQHNERKQIGNFQPSRRYQVIGILVMVVLNQCEVIHLRDTPRFNLKYYSASHS